MHRGVAQFHRISDSRDRFRAKKTTTVRMTTAFGGTLERSYTQFFKFIFWKIKPLNFELLILLVKALICRHNVLSSLNLADSMIKNYKF